jgi:hypothetical protein
MSRLVTLEESFSESGLLGTFSSAVNIVLTALDGEASRICVLVDRLSLPTMEVDASVLRESCVVSLAASSMGGSLFFAEFAGLRLSLLAPGC